MALGGETLPREFLSIPNASALTHTYTHFHEHTHVFLDLHILLVPPWLTLFLPDTFVVNTVSPVSAAISSNSLALSIMCSGTPTWHGRNLSTSVTFTPNHAYTWKHAHRDTHLRSFTHLHSEA